MAVDKLVDSAQLNSDLTSVANAIRTKSGGSGQLAFPTGFVSEIGSIQTGGGDGPTETLLASGTFTKTDGGDIMTIPVSYSGTPTKFLVSAQAPIEGVSQTTDWTKIMVAITEIKNRYPNDVFLSKSCSATGTVEYRNATCNISAAAITCHRITSGNPVRDNTYNWYIWGYAE